MLSESNKGAPHRCFSPEMQGKPDSRPIVSGSSTKASVRCSSDPLVDLTLMSIIMGDEDSSQLFHSITPSQPKSSPLDLLDDIMRPSDDCSDPFDKNLVAVNKEASNKTLSFESSMSEDLEPLPIAPIRFPSLTSFPCTPIHLSATSAIAEGALERLLAQEINFGESVDLKPIAVSSGVKRSQQEDDGESSQVPQKKRCIFHPRTSTKIGEEGPKFRDYQEQQWNDKFEALLTFKSLYGHCLVPHTYEQDPALARWVKRQRYQYKLFQKPNGESTMTIERKNALERIGFAWDSHAVGWEERLQELKAFQAEFGHCNVPSDYQRSTSLSVWVKRQRRQFKLFWKGERSTITQERFIVLRDLGFTWELRRSKNSVSMNKEV